MELAGKFAQYYAPGENGEPSPYAGRFGEFAVPANEIILITDLVVQALQENHGCTAETQWADKPLVALEEFLAGREGIKATEVYKFLIEHRLRGLSVDGQIKFNMLDYGCGDGRHWPFYVELAKALRAHGISLNIIGYEILDVPLRQFEAKATGMDTDNLTLRLIQGREEELPKFEAREFDVALCLFGVISYEITPETRAPIIKLLYDVTSSAVMFGVPTRKLMADGQIKILADHGTYITYEAAGQNFDYAYFSEHIDFAREIAMATAEPVNKAGARIVHMQFPMIGDVTRPTHGSQSLESYVKAMREGSDPENVGLYIYQTHIMRPDVQRGENIGYGVRFEASCAKREKVCLG